MPEIWETADLLEVTYSDQAAPDDSFWSRFFPRTFNSEAQEIFFKDIEARDRRLAPFVAPTVQGRVMRLRGENMKSFAPAYLKPKGIVDPTKAVPGLPAQLMARLAQQGGQLSLEQRYDAHVAAHLKLQRETIARRIDHMQSEAIIYGRVTVSGEDYPTRVVDFERDPSLTMVLTGAAEWDASGDALADIGTLRPIAFQKGRAAVRDLIFGLDAFTAFSEQDKVKALLDNMKRGSESNFNTTGLSEGGPVEYMGQISGPNGAGRLNLFTYSNEYEDESGSMVPYLDTRDVIGVGGNIGGVQAYGAIMDKKAGLRPLPLFPKMWDNDDPDATYVMSQSAPLPVPTNINNSFRIRALS